MKARIIAALVLALIAVSACSMPRPSGTPIMANFVSGRDGVKNAAVDEMISRGYSIVRNSEYEISFDKPAPEMFWHKTALYPIPSNRLTMILTGDGPTWVSIMPYVVSNPGSSLELEADYSGSAEVRANVLEIVNNIKARVNARSEAGTAEDG